MSMPFGHFDHWHVCLYNFYSSRIAILKQVGTGRDKLSGRIQVVSCFSRLLRYKEVSCECQVFKCNVIWTCIGCKRVTDIAISMSAIGFFASRLPWNPLRIFWIFLRPGMYIHKYVRISLSYIIKCTDINFCIFHC